MTSRKPPVDELCLAIDVGTSSVKAVAIGADGHATGRGRRALSVRRTGDATVTQSVDEIWHALVAAGADAVGDAGRRVTSIVLSTQRASFVPLDSRGQVLHDLVSWQDHRCAGELARLGEAIGADTFYRLTGLALDPTPALPKIMALSAREPEVAARTACFASLQGAILHRLGCAQPLSTYSDAAYLGAFDITQRDWSAELCDAAGIAPAVLGDAVPSGRVVGRVDRTVAAAIGISPQTALVTGGGDLQCGALGAGVTGPGAITVGLGTGGHCVGYVDEPTYFPGRVVNCQPHVLPDAWEVEGIALSSASTLSWIAGLVSGSDSSDSSDGSGGSGIDWTRVMALAASAPPGAAGVRAVPALNGGGCPDWRPDLAGALLGLRLSHSPGDVLRAFVEGICFELRRIRDTMSTVLGATDEVRLWGGPARSPFWAQLVADVLAAPVRAEPQEGAGLVGAAVLGFVAVDRFASHAEASDQLLGSAPEFTPDAALRGAYDDAYAGFLDAVAATAAFASGAGGFPGG